MNGDTTTFKSSARGPWRLILWALLLIALFGSLGFFAARGDVELPAALELEQTFSKVRQTLSEVEDRLTATPAPMAATNADEEALLGRIADLETRIALDAALDAEPLLRGIDVRGVDVRGVDVRVEVSRDTAVLRGSVATAEQKETAEAIAVSLVGDRRVANRLVVGGAEDRRRTQLARRVEFELFASEAFDVRLLDVAAEGSIVTLRGSVRSTAERLLAVRIAAGVAGVSDVTDELRVAGRTAGATMALDAGLRAGSQ